MPGPTNSTVRASVHSAVQDAPAHNSRANLEKLSTPPMEAKLLDSVKKHRSDHVNAFQTALDGGQSLGIARVLKREVGPQIAKDFLNLFGKNSELTAMANDLKTNENNIAHLRSKENVEKATTLGLIHRGLEEFKSALMMADKAPQAGENFVAHEKKLLVMAKRLTTLANAMPTSSEGAQMAKLLSQLSEVCITKSKLIAANAGILSGLVNYDKVLPAIDQQIDAIDLQFEQLGAQQNKSQPETSLDQHVALADKMLALSEQRTALVAQREGLYLLQSAQEEKISALPPKLQQMADAKMFVPSASSLQSHGNVSASQDSADFKSSGYASAIDVLNIKIASLFNSGNTKAGLTLIVFRDKLETAMNSEAQKAASPGNGASVKNVLPDGAKKLGLIARIRVKFHAKSATQLGKNLKPFNPNLGKLNLQTTLAAYLQGAYKFAGLKGDDLPSKKNLREELRAGLGNPNRPAAYGRVDANKPEVTVDNVKTKTNPLEAAYAEKGKKFDSDASSAYEKLIRKNFISTGLTAASVQNLFLARQHASKMILNPAMAGAVDHAKNRQLLDAEHSSRPLPEHVKQGLYADKDSKLLDHGRLITHAEILLGLEGGSSLKNVAGMQAFGDTESMETAVNVFLASNVGPVYGLMNLNQNHWATVISTINAKGAVDTYTVDTTALQEEKELPNACGPLQILMHAELSKRLAENPVLDAIQTMKDIESNVQALDKNTLRSVVLQQRIEVLDKLISSAPTTDPTGAAGYAQQIDALAEAFTF